MELNQASSNPLVPNVLEIGHSIKISNALGSLADIELMDDDDFPISLQ
jgi:hypothetical protein